jgi:hypothetical protein
MPQAASSPAQPKAAPSKVALRLNCPRALYERISAYRHDARHDSRAQAMITLLAAGLAALSRSASVSPPARPKQLVAFAGFEDDGLRCSP